jgi:uncharacterized protein (DUF924 family)
MITPSVILDFWFDPAEAPDYPNMRKRWFAKDPAFDGEIRRRFQAHHESAVAGAFAAWRESAYGCLALILLFDQFPRNMFRDTPRAFATDALARAVAAGGLSNGHDRGLNPSQRQFFYLPFLHSETLPDQELGVQLMRLLSDADTPDSPYDFAKRHHAIIARFGRFPHRNSILGRPSTPEEELFLAQQEARF